MGYITLYVTLEWERNARRGLELADVYSPFHGGYVNFVQVPGYWCDRLERYVSYSPVCVTEWVRLLELEATHERLP